MADPTIYRVNPGQTVDDVVKQRGLKQNEYETFTDDDGDTRIYAHGAQKILRDREKQKKQSENKPVTRGQIAALRQEAYMTARLITDPEERKRAMIAALTLGE